MLSKIQHSTGKGFVEVKRFQLSLVKKQKGGKERNIFSGDLLHDLKFQYTFRKLEYFILI